MNSKKTSWGAVAKWYDDMLEDESDSYQKKVLMPNLIRIVDPKPGMNILDIACGQGYFARAFYENGATVTGCDISPELIALANKALLTPSVIRGVNNSKSNNVQNITSNQNDINMTSPPSKVGREINTFSGPEIKLGNSSKRKGEISFKVAKADQLDVSSSTFDLAIIVLALQNIENLSGTMMKASKALKSGGRLIIVINHPAFRIPRSSSWQWAESNNKLENPDIKGEKIDQLKMYRRIDAYMSDQTFKIDMTPGEEDLHKKKFTVSFHRPLQSYFKAMSKAGLSVTRLEEWISHKKSQPGPRSSEEDRMRKEIPMFLCLEAVKS